MSTRWIRNIIIVMYIMAGIVIAWDHGYLGLGWLRTVASGLLAVFLWWLVLVGVNLHIRS